MVKTILIATEKPFAKKAIRSIRKIVQGSKGFQVSVLENYTDKKALIDAVKDAEALIVRSDLVTDEVMESAKKLKIVVRAGSGVDNVDLDSATKQGIVVMNTPGQNANAVAELSFGLMIGLIRNKYNGAPGTELKGKSIGMHGFGNIGKCMSFIAKGFGMKVLAYDPYIDQELMVAYGVEPCETLEELYKDCNFISINIPATEETVESIDYKLLSVTRKRAMLINTARKELIKEEDLLRIMNERPAYMYASDVAPACEQEMKEKYPQRILFTKKKMGAQTAEANINAGVAAVTQIIKFFNKNDTTFKVN